MSRKTNHDKRDAIAEQSLAATIRKLIAGDIALQFPKIETIGEGENEVAIINPPLQFKLSRLVKGTEIRIAFALPIQPEEVADDKGLAIALASAYYAFIKYEEQALKSLPPDVTGNGSRKIIIPGHE